MYPLTARIDLAAIAHNVAVLKRQAGDARLVCVVKADAYNHGIARCVPVMAANGADAFGVATFAEARAVRAVTDLPVIAWLWAPAEDIPEGVELGVPSMGHLQALIDGPLPATPRTVYLKVDTGMQRSGFDEAEWDLAFAAAAEAERAGAIKVAGLMSHLASADTPEDPYNDTQGGRFRDAIDRAREAGLDPQVNHLANSPATWARPDLHFQQVRPGVSLYGLEPIAGEDHGLRPAMTWVGSILAVKRVRAGDSVSYGQTWRAPADGFTAVVPAGYADGIARAWQPRLAVTVDGTRYPVVGRVCMDQVVLWLEGNERGVRPGDEAIIFGAGGMSATELADAVGTINYEVVCSPKGRTVREYLT
ncbi:alanine racemase [Corynebacterium aquatimens]|uniref:alanine racemase n=1 Tax=Corynebacterium TaxID=1716 RepID=UPI001F40AA90|nr:MULTISPECIES: alanine racemase [Corynebacterium]QYH20219.1 alanine racemase [Corynebacterium aquatimens]UIZ92516.1 alanine racemase [Corynebacterium sp. CNCTC7651]